MRTGAEGSKAAPRFQRAVFVASLRCDPLGDGQTLKADTCEAEFPFRVEQSECALSDDLKSARLTPLA